MQQYGQRARKAEAGTTLIELVVVLMIFAILMAIGVPSYRYVTFSNRVSGEANAMLGDLQFARSEAVKEGQMVTVCPSAAGTQCDANSTNWQTGWIVFSDINSNQTVAAATNILQVRAAFPPTVKDTLTSDNGLSFVSFNREGFATAFPAGVAANGYVTMTLHTTPLSPQWTRCVQVFSTGLMNVEKTTDPQGNCQ